MTLNPIKALSEALEKLIIEHGSAVVQQKHIALLREQLAILDKQFSVLSSENESLKSENQTLKSHNQALAVENDKLRQIIQKYKQPHGILLGKEKTDMLLFLSNHQGELMTFQIAKSLNISEDIATYHLEELHKNKFIREGLPYSPGQHSWVIEPKGKKYLIENKLIS